MTEMSIINEESHRHKSKSHGSPHKGRHHRSKERDSSPTRHPHHKRDPKKKARSQKKNRFDRITKEQELRTQAVYEQVISETVKKTRRRRCCQMMTLLIVVSIVLGIVVFLAFYFVNDVENDEANRPTTSKPGISSTSAS